MFKEGKRVMYTPISLRTFNLIGTIRSTVAALLVAGICFSMLSFVYVSSGSMLPTLKIGSTICAKKLDEKAPIERGDIVIFSPFTEQNKDMYLDETKELYIKRVIGLPGDTVEIRSDGTLYLNGQITKESYIPDGLVMQPFDRITIPEGQYFLMGDNRNHSSDSRVIGTIPRENIMMKSLVNLPSITSILITHQQQA